MIKIEIINKKILKEIYRPRQEWAHKGDFGSLLIIGGSKLYSGSPAFAGLAAYRSGVDLVTIAAPERAANIIASFSPDLITYPLYGDYLSDEHVKELLKLTEGKTAVAIGGGLCRENRTMKAVRKYLRKINLPCVIDADAIHAVARERRLLRNNFVVTPHSNEFYVLTGVKPEPDEQNRIALVKNVASKLGCVVLLKGHVDVVSDGIRIAINKTGNPLMTVGGTGDTLTGICGAILARNVDPFAAACAACYINGLAGDLASKRLREGLMASDLIDEIPKAIKKK